MPRSFLMPSRGGGLAPRRRAEYLDEINGRFSIGADEYDARSAKLAMAGGLTREDLASFLRDMIRSGEGIPYERSGPIACSTTSVVTSGGTFLASGTTQRSIKTAGLVIASPDSWVITSIKFGADEIMPSTGDVPAAMFNTAGTLNDFMKGRVLGAGMSIFIAGRNVTGASITGFYAAFAVDSD